MTKKKDRWDLVLDAKNSRKSFLDQFKAELIVTLITLILWTSIITMAVWRGEIVNFEDLPYREGSAWEFIVISVAMVATVAIGIIKFKKCHNIELVVIRLVWPEMAFFIIIFQIPDLLFLLDALASSSGIERVAREMDVWISILTIASLGLIITIDIMRLRGDIRECKVVINTRDFGRDHTYMGDLGRECKELNGNIACNSSDKEKTWSSVE